jgi:hypothetical protein
VREGLEEAAPAVDEGVVATAGLERGRGVRVGHPDVGPTGVEAEAGRDVEPGQLRDVGGDGRREHLLGPGHRLEALERPDHDGRVGGDGRRPFDVTAVSGPAEGGAQVGELGVRPVERAALLRPVPDVPLAQDLSAIVAAVRVPHA